MKILVIGRRSVFKAESYGDKNSLFGYSTDITRPTRDNSSLSATCLEYRCANSSENVKMVVGPTSEGCRFYSAASGLCPTLQEEKCSIYYNRRLHRSSNVGLYEFRHGVEQGRCRAGRLWGRAKHMSSRGYALFYDCRY